MHYILLTETVKSLSRFLSSRFRKGFTLIELLVVMSMLGILSTISIASFTTFNDSHALESATLDINNTLQTARSRSLSGYKPTQCSGQSLSGFQVAISASQSTFQLGVVCGTSAYVLETKTLPGKVYFAPSSPANTFFAAGTGAANPGQIILLKSGQSQTVSINAAGIITVLPKAASTITPIISQPSPTAPTPTSTQFQLPTATPLPATPTPTLQPSPNTGPPQYMQTATGASSGTTSVSTAAPLTGASGNLYVAAIATKPGGSVSVTNVSGLGLTWRMAEAQCTGRGAGRVEIWWAQGNATTGTVVANFSGTPLNAVISVSRYAGADSIAPTGNSSSANTLGVNGACTGGIDTSSYTTNISAGSNSVIFGAVSLRAAGNTAGAGYIERGEIHQGAGGDVAGVAVQDRIITGSGTVAFNGTTSTAVDWAAAAVEIKSGGVTQPANPTPTTIPQAPTPTPTPRPVATPTPTPVPSTATPPVHVQTITGVSSGLATVSTATTVTGGNYLYVAAVSSKPNRSLSSISGLGLTWRLADAQCSARGVGRVEVWWAKGTATSGTVTATLSTAPLNAVIAVSRYSGGNSVTPIGNTNSANIAGVNSLTCTGTTVDTASYTVNLTTTGSNAVAYGAVYIRNSTNAPGTSYTERADLMHGAGGDIAGLAVMDRTVTSATTVPVNGTLSGVEDWAVVGVEIK